MFIFHSTMLCRLIILIFVSSCTSEIDDKNVKEYLHRYGYLGSPETSLSTLNSSDYIFALKAFQAQYNLPVEETVNKETLQLMNTPRCGVPDNQFAIHHSKWNTSVITWSFNQVTPELFNLARKAFEIWERHTNLKFQFTYGKAMITISMRNRLHTYVNQNGVQCSFDLNDLAHAFMPNRLQEPREIHISDEVDWYIGTSIVPKDKTSLLIALTHEIGHSLGVRHTSVQSALMFPYYNQYSDDLSKFDLSQDDIWAIESLYGRKYTATTVTTSKPTTIANNLHTTASKLTTIAKNSHTTASKPTVKTPYTTRKPIATTKRTQKPVNKPDLCSLSKIIETFLIVNHKLYIFYKKYVWIINLGEKAYREPLLITDWLTFLPSDFTKFDAIYQRPSGEIVFFAASNIYVMSYPSLQLLPGYPKVNTVLGQGQAIKINGAINTYTGRTIIFYNDHYFLELNECNFQRIRYGAITSEFPGIPTDLTAVFRYTNGYTYFFNKNNFYEYNEFSNVLVRAGKKSLDIFGLNCPYENILQRLHKLLSNLMSFKINDYENYGYDPEDRNETSLSVF